MRQSLFLCVYAPFLGLKCLFLNFEAIVIIHYQDIFFPFFLKGKIANNSRVFAGMDIHL